MKKYLIIPFLVGLLFIVACTPVDCPTACARIPASENSPPFDLEKLEFEGCYYGALDQKKPGTPDDWVHFGEGTRSAVWCAPTAVEAEGCDCNLWKGVPKEREDSGAQGEELEQQLT